MKLFLISPGVDLAEYLADYLLNSGRPLTSFWIVFPESRPAHYLRKALAARLKKGFLPPKLSSLDEFVDLIYTEFLKLDYPLIDPIEAIAFLYRIHTEHPASSFFGLEQNPSFITLDEFFPLGMKIFNDLEELKSGLVTRDQFLMIDNLVPEKIPPQARSRFQKLSFFYQEFYTRLEKEGFSTRASRLITILNNFSPEALGSAEELLLVGFFSLSRAETALMKKILESEKTSLWLFESQELETFIAELGLKEAETQKVESPHRPQAKIEFHQSPDSHGQLFSLRNLLSEGIESPGQLSEKQVIVLPAAETLIPLYEQVLSALPPESFNISLGYPVARTPVFSFFSNLFNLVQTVDEENRIYAPEYLNFVLHPYTKNIYFPARPRRADLTRILFHTLENILTQKKGKLFWSLEEIEAEPELEKRLALYSAENPEDPEVEEFIKHLKTIHHQTIRPFLKIQNIRDFAAKCLNLLQFIANQSTASLHLFFQPYAEVFLNKFERLKNSLIAGLKFSQNHSYFNLFRKLFSEVRVPFPGTPLHGLQVLGFWETRGLKFDEVYLLDMNEEIIPATGRVDSLLPLELRRALKLPTHKDQEKKIEYYLRTLLNGARIIHLFFVENSQKEKSRYVEKLLWEKQKVEGLTEPEAILHKISYQICLKNPEPVEIPKSPEVLEYLSHLKYTASNLDSYLKCPLKFYYSAVLKLKEKEEIAEMLEKTEIGTLVHSLLKCYFEPFKGKNIPANPDLKRLDKIVETEFGRLFSQPLTGSFFLMRHQVQNHLEEFLQNYQQKLVEKLGFWAPRLLDLEAKIELQYQVDGRTFNLAGQLDRIEERHSYLCLLDYKTSASEKSYAIDFKNLKLDDRTTWPEAVSSLQTSFYQILLGFKSGRPPEEIYSAVLLLGRNRIDEKIEYCPLLPKRDRKKKEGEKRESEVFPLNHSEEVEMARRENFQVVKKLLDQLLLEIVNPEVPFTSKLAAEASCRRCPYVNFCGS
jgi:CRISPR/Cas system-associated exonuclease Cas4 (RecB family)